MFRIVPKCSVNPTEHLLTDPVSSIMTTVLIFPHSLETPDSICRLPRKPFPRSFLVFLPAPLPWADKLHQLHLQGANLDPLIIADCIDYINKYYCRNNIEPVERTPDFNSSPHLTPFAVWIDHLVLGKHLFHRIALIFFLIIIPHQEYRYHSAIPKILNNLTGGDLSRDLLFFAYCLSTNFVHQFYGSFAMNRLNLFSAVAKKDLYNWSALKRFRQDFFDRTDTIWSADKLAAAFVELNNSTDESSSLTSNEEVQEANTNNNNLVTPMDQAMILSVALRSAGAVYSRVDWNSHQSILDQTAGSALGNSYLLNGKLLPSSNCPIKELGIKTGDIIDVVEGRCEYCNEKCLNSSVPALHNSVVGLIQCPDTIAKQVRSWGAKTIVINSVKDIESGTKCLIMPRSSYLTHELNTFLRHPIIENKFIKTNLLLEAWPLCHISSACLQPILLAQTAYRSASTSTPSSFFASPIFNGRVFYMKANQSLVESTPGTVMRPDLSILSGEYGPRMEYIKLKTIPLFAQVISWVAELGGSMVSLAPLEDAELQRMFKQEPNATEIRPSHDHFNIYYEFHDWEPEYDPEITIAELLSLPYLNTYDLEQLTGAGRYVRPINPCDSPIDGYWLGDLKLYIEMPMEVRSLVDSHSVDKRAHRVVSHFWDSYMYAAQQLRGDTSIADPGDPPKHGWDWKYFEKVKAIAHAAGATWIRRLPVHKVHWLRMLHLNSLVKAVVIDVNPAHQTEKYWEEYMNIHLNQSETDILMLPKLNQFDLKWLLKSRKERNITFPPPCGTSSNLSSIASDINITNSSSSTEETGSRIYLPINTNNSASAITNNISMAASSNSGQPNISSSGKNTNTSAAVSSNNSSSNNNNNRSSCVTEPVSLTGGITSTTRNGKTRKNNVSFNARTGNPSNTRKRKNLEPDIFVGIPKIAPSPQSQQYQQSQSSYENHNVASCTNNHQHYQQYYPQHEQASHMQLSTTSALHHPNVPESANTRHLHDLNGNAHNYQNSNANLVAAGTLRNNYQSQHQSHYLRTYSNWNNQMSQTQYFGANLDPVDNISLNLQQQPLDELRSTNPTGSILPFNSPKSPYTPILSAPLSPHSQQMFSSPILNLSSNYSLS